MHAPDGGWGRLVEGLHLAPRRALAAHNSMATSPDAVSSVRMPRRACNTRKSRAINQPTLAGWEAAEERRKGASCPSMWCWN
jgi:hypothetical protein